MEQMHMQDSVFLRCSQRVFRESTQTAWPLAIVAQWDANHCVVLEETANFKQIGSSALVRWCLAVFRSILRHFFPV